jgi:DNA-binding GntR family transcriptional regulator
MSLDSDKTIMSDIPKHVQIANIVREQILNGSLSTGTRLCSDKELAKQYNLKFCSSFSCLIS